MYNLKSIFYLLIISVIFINTYFIPVTQSVSVAVSVPPQQPTLYDSDDNIDATLCMGCVDFLEDYLPTLIKVISDYGIYESCSKICSFLNKTIEVDACDALCSLVGVDAFYKIFLMENINPIYACQLATACETPKHPAAKFTKITMSPPSGVAGTTFNIGLEFTVINDTGVGQFTYIVYYLTSQTKYIYSETFSGYSPGEYSVHLPFKTTDNSTFSPGMFPLQVFLCASECGAQTPTSLLLNTTSSEFLIKTSPSPSPSPTPTPTPTSTPTPIPTNTPSNTPTSTPSFKIIVNK